LVILSVFGVDSVQKYHSIHKSGKSLEDALSEEELKVLREYVAVITSHPAINHARDYGEFIEETETPSGAAAETNGDADRQDAEMIHAGSNGITDVDQAEAQQQVRIDQRCHYISSRPVQRSRRGRMELLLLRCQRLCSAQVRLRVEKSWPGQGDVQKHWQETRWLLLVQDENMKNIMMSWYYAGYYTGLHAGQQQVPKDTPPTQ
jgi:hypothetical protein